MFRPNEDRVEYGAELMPPPGWHLVRAVATTYSLDFETLIAALIPLGLGGDIDDKEMHNPISIIIPCHRVISTSGNLTGYAGGLSRKEQLLQIELQAI